MSTGAAAAIIFTFLITTAVPLGVMLLLRRRSGAWTAFLTGAGTFIVFALILEPLLHNLVLRSGIGTAIQNNIWLYGLYGGLAAGIFEETGRFIAFRFVLRNRRDRRDRTTALSCGIGHGGMEAFLLVGLTMASNLILGLTYSGVETPPPEIAAALETLFTVPAVHFLWSGFERLTAMALHMSLSVLVFASVRTERRWLFPAAVLAHAAVDFAAVTANASLPIAATEGLVLLVTVPVAVLAVWTYKKLPEIVEIP